MKKYTRHFGTQTPQYQRIPESEQVKNRAGGWVFPVTDQVQAERFLILGTSENTYYAFARELTREVATCIDRLLEGGQGEWLVQKIVEISDSGRAAKNDSAIFALAMAIREGDVATRRAAAVAMPRVCRTGTHVAQFANAVKIFSKVSKDSKGEHYAWPRVVKRAFQNRLDAWDDDGLAYQLVKYRQREGWTWADMLRRLKPSGLSATNERDALYAWATGKATAGTVVGDAKRTWLPEIVQAFEEAQAATEADDIIRLINEYNLPWEAIPSQWARNLDVQYELLLKMPITAMIRQLGRLTNLGLLAPQSEATKFAGDRITNPVVLGRGRVHPMSVYLASEVYRVGSGLRGKLSWQPVGEIVDALGSAFFTSFGNVEPTGKNIVVGVDCSGSMSVGGVMGIPGFRASEAAFVSAYVQSRIEPSTRILRFDTSAQEVTFRAETLSQLQTEGRKIFGQGGGTDCSSPIVYAHQNIHDADAFVIYTDGETWFGNIHPIEANWQYREKWGRRTKLVSQAFVATDTSINPVDDAESLAVIGMDESAPSIITDFLR